MPIGITGKVPLINYLITRCCIVKKAPSKKRGLFDALIYMSLFSPDTLQTTCFTLEISTLNLYTIVNR